MCHFDNINDVVENFVFKERLFVNCTITYRPLKSRADAATLQSDHDKLANWLEEQYRMEFYPENAMPSPFLENEIQLYTITH